MLRRLKIAVSVFFAVLTVALCVLWVRSCFRFDQFVRPISTVEYAAFTSAQGRILLGRSTDRNLGVYFGTGWTHLKFSLSHWEEAAPIPFFPASVSEERAPGIFPWLQFNKDFYIQQFPTGTSYEVVLPYWMLVVTFASFAALPWLRWRFSLRTMLIATTLVAVVLGLIVYASRG